MPAPRISLRPNLTLRVPTRTPAAPPVVTRATRAPSAPAPTVGVPAQPPAGLDSKQLADWHVAQVHAHERLRTLSFYDTGHHLMQSRVLGAVAKIAPRIAKTKPELFAPLRAAGWKLTGSG